MLTGVDNRHRCLPPTQPVRGFADDAAGPLRERTVTNSAPVAAKIVVWHVIGSDHASHVFLAFEVDLVLATETVFRAGEVHFQFRVIRDLNASVVKPVAHLGPRLRYAS